MNKRDTTADEPRGAILEPRVPLDLRFVKPTERLAPWVLHFWFLRWDLTEPQTSSVLPRPAVNLTFEGPLCKLTGLQTKRFDRRVEGRGEVYGVQFLPAGFAGFVDFPLHELTDQRIDYATQLAVDAATFFLQLSRAARDEDRRQPYEDLLAAQNPTHTPIIDELNMLVAHAERTPSLSSAETLARHAGVSLRTLQRRLRQYVGIGPKQLLLRFRLQEAAARLSEGETIPEVAYSLGYADQAHFSRDFARTIGRPPGRYLRPT